MRGSSSARAALPRVAVEARSCPGSTRTANRARDGRVDRTVGVLLARTRITGNVSDARFAAATMSDIFICYRRSDSAGFAGRLHDHLVERFGSRSVFVDVDNLHPGQDFNRVIQSTLQRSSVVLVVIGRHWMDQRLRNEDDYVRREIIAALRGKKRVIPVLVHDAQMPAPGKLPPELALLAGKQAIPLRDLSWKADVARLVTSLQRTLARKKATDISDPAKPPRNARAAKAVGAKPGDAAAPAPRPPVQTKRVASKTPTTAPRRKKAERAAAAPPRAHPGGQAEERLSAGAAPDSSPRRAKPGTGKAPGGKTGTSARSAPASGRKASGAAAPPVAVGRESGTVGSGGRKGAAKAPGAGGGRRKKKPVAGSTPRRSSDRARRTR